MSDTIILHHYEMSPYAEKIRLMFGLTNMRWHSLLSPVQPPRPNLDPLTGGYRRIPVAQIGADIFCDSSLIAQEVSKAADYPALDPMTIDAKVSALMEKAEKQAFFAAIGAVKPLRLLGTMLLQFGPVGAYRFVQDRSGLLRGGTVRPARGADAQLVLDSLLEELETQLAGQRWLAGDTASVADFSVYHPLWLYVSCNRKPLDAGANVKSWYQRVSEIGQGKREEISCEEAFGTARIAEPRALPSSIADSAINLGTAVNVGPSDYGLQPVAGNLAALTTDRIVLARDSDEFGRVHVHFPRAGYALAAQ